MMKNNLILCAILTLAIAYDAKYDQFDAENAVKDPAVVAAVMKCFINTGPCSELAAAYKELMSEVVATSCAKCSPRQKEIFKVVMRAAKNEFPELYTTFKKEYDPDNTKGADLDAFIS